MNYRTVDRSHFTPTFDGRMGDEVFDIGWAEGVLNDGRPYRLECWGFAGRTGVSLFMASEGFSGDDPLPVHALLEASGVITTLVPQELSLLHFVDPAGTPCLSISYVVADEDDEYFVQAHPVLQPYRREGTLDVREPVHNTQAASTHDARDDYQALVLTIDQMLDAWAAESRQRSPMAEARRAAKALAKLQPKKKRTKRRKFRK